MTWSEEFKNSLKLKEVEEIFDLFFYRPLAFLLVKAVYRTKITPNQLTVTAIVLGLAAGYFYSVGKPYWIAAGAVFFILSNVFDCSDGQLARLKHNGTAIGRIIDGLADTIVFVAVYLGIAIGFANHQENPAYWWIMLVVTGLSTGIHSVLVDYYRNRFLDFYTLRKNNFEDGLQEFKDAYELVKHQKGKRFERWVILFYLRFSAMQRILVARKKQTKVLNVSPQEYYRKNRIIMRFWLILGPTTQITNIIVFSLFHRFDLFIWVVLFGFNGLAILLWATQKIIDKTYKSPGE
jgi:hypothetical protein